MSFTFLSIMALNKTLLDIVPREEGISAIAHHKFAVSQAESKAGVVGIDPLTEHMC